MIRLFVVTPISNNRDVCFPVPAGAAAPLLSIEPGKQARVGSERNGAAGKFAPQFLQPLGNCIVAAQPRQPEALMRLLGQIMSVFDNQNSVSRFGEAQAVDR